MSPEDVARTRLRHLEQEVLAELDALSEIRSQIARFAFAEELPNDARWAALAVQLHGYYGAVESALTRIVRTVDGEVPAGGEWHKSLLLSASRPLRETRSEIVSLATFDHLMRLLGFRHFFRHAYAVRFDGARLVEHAERTLGCHDQIVQELLDFVEQLARS